MAEAYFLLGMTRKVEIIWHVSEEELVQLYRGEKNLRIKGRLHAILLLYRGYRADEMADDTAGVMLL